MEKHLITVENEPQHRPHIIAIRDPPTVLTTTRLHGYNPWYSWTNLERGPDAGVDCIGSPREGRLGRTDATNPTEDASIHGSKPDQIAHVAFYVDSSIPTRNWKIRQPEASPNKGKVATLKLTTASTTLAIHNVYNWLETVNISDLLGMINESEDSILLGDFNLHHPDWSGNSQKKKLNPFC